CNSLKWGPDSTFGFLDTPEVVQGAITSTVSQSNTTPSAMGANATYATVTFTVPAGQSWPVLVTGTANANLSTAPTGGFRLKVDGTTVQGTYGWNSAMASQIFTTAFNYTTSLSAGSHTILIEGSNTAGSATFEAATVTVSE